MKMKAFVRLFAVLGICIAVRGDEPLSVSQEEYNLIAQICTHLSEMPAITSVNLDASADWNLRSYLDLKSYFERDCAQLQKLNPELQDTTFMCGDKPFNQLLKEGRELIAKNDAVIAAAKKDRPDAEAIKAIDGAIMFGKAGVRSLMDGSKFSTISDYYKAYVDGKDRASKIDMRALDLRRDEIAAIEKALVEPYLKLQQQNEDTEKAKLAEAEAERKQKAEKQRKMYEAMDNHAKDLGFSGGATFGISALVDELNNEILTQSEAKKLLIHPVSWDRYKVQNIEDRYVFYMDTSGDEFLQIAIVRDKNKVYSTGSELPTESTYNLVGFGDFTTVQGAAVQLPIFKRIE
jgi:hypothetical protein